MKKVTLISTLVLSTLTASAFANSQNGGFQDPNAPQQTTQVKQKGEFRHGGYMNSNQAVSKVTEVSSMNDDQYVVLQGKIVKQVGKEDFLFRDASGEINVEIERKAWVGQEITPNNEVKLYGEVDKSWNKTDIEVHRVEKLN
ncbi:MULTISPECIES: YgiW/YdeI family stress tolerance OB fold protein [Glaesserella]|uniref:TIGR00156 family protein n=1 Tax=Glaesserella australis TaxID=2094024 RepID=A0A328BXW1_9PAST|nr:MULTISPECIES: NirD/YgiW/YdeI family stress tolerance protein [Glaesserella]AUI66999.1 TIGR00156 family protein [Glaesserella sp. 15-184]RAL18909.1 TIGR00156 family protein [Glaesserella australis]